MIGRRGSHGDRLGTLSLTAVLGITFTFNELV